MDLEDYTSIHRKGPVISFENILNKWNFPTVEEAKNFEKLYLHLEIKALKEMMLLIKDHKIVKNAEQLKEEELANYAKHYYIGGGVVGSYSGITREDTIKEAERMHSLSKDIKVLREFGLI